MINKRPDDPAPHRGPLPATGRWGLGPAKERVLEALVDRGPIGIAALADLMQLHPNSVRDQLDQLLAAGHVRRVRAEAGARGRPAWHYEVTSDPGPGGSGAVVAALAAHLHDSSPDPRGAGRAAGHAYGRTLHADIPELMATHGFAPEPRGAEKMLLTRCPVLEAARAYPDVVCALHLGLVEGALEALGRPEAAALHPFADERGCLLRLVAK